MGLFGSGVAAAGSAADDAEAELALLDSKEYAGLWNATASVRLVVVAPLPPDAAAASVAAAPLGSTQRDRSVEAGVLGAGDLAGEETEMEVGMEEGVR